MYNGVFHALHFVIQKRLTVLRDRQFYCHLADSNPYYWFTWCRDNGICPEWLLSNG